MKIIDFLKMENKPKKFKYKNYIWNKYGKVGIYYNEDDIVFETYLVSVQICDLGRNLIEVLNDEIEIIEDELKKIEEFKKTKTRYDDPLNMMTYIKEEYNYTKEELYDKLNEVIGQLNGLLEKSDTTKL